MFESMPLPLSTRPYWQVVSELRSVTAQVDAVAPLEDLRGKYLAKVADAFEAGDSAAFDMASTTYDDIAHLAELRLNQRRLIHEKSQSRPPESIEQHLGGVALALGTLALGTEIISDAAQAYEEPSLIYGDKISLDKRHRTLISLPKNKIDK